MVELVESCKKAPNLSRIDGVGTSNAGYADVRRNRRARQTPIAGFSDQGWQFSGTSASIRRVAPAGISWTAYPVAIALVSLRIMCTWSPPESTNVAGAWYTCGWQ
jgi:hypothetical protein